MVEQLSPLEPIYRHGVHGAPSETPGIILTETRPASIVQVACFAGEEQTCLGAIERATGLALSDRPGGGARTEFKSGFGIAPGRYLLVDQAEGLAATLRAVIGPSVGTVTDLSHGRTAIRAEGPKVEWVLSKFFAIDFTIAAFTVDEGRATSHHDIFAHIQRTGTERFDIYVFRSFARSFWTALCHGAEEVGYEVR